jgi:hypothetical protein
MCELVLWCRLTTRRRNRGRGTAGGDRAGEAQLYRAFLKPVLARRGGERGKKKRVEAVD